MKAMSNAELEFFDGHNCIIMSIDGRGNDGHYSENDWRCDANLVEISYREDEGDEWGIGSDEFISTTDIKGMAECIRNVMYHKKDKDHYECRNDILHILLEFHKDTDTYTLALSLIETLIRDHHITVMRDSLTKAELEKYTNPFFVWEKQYPIIKSNQTNYGSN